MVEKKPQDHKAKAGAVKVQGIELSIPLDRMNDWDVTEGMSVAADESADQGARLIASVKVVKAVLGSDYERVKTELREKHGGVLTAEIMNDFMTEVFKELNPNV